MQKKIKTMKTKFSKKIEKELLGEGKIDTYFSDGEIVAYFNHGEKLENGDWDLFGVLLTEGGTFSCTCLLSELEDQGFVYDEKKNVNLRKLK